MSYFEHYVLMTYNLPPWGAPGEAKRPRPGSGEEIRARQRSAARRITPIVRAFAGWPRLTFDVPPPPERGSHQACADSPTG